MAIIDSAPFQRLRGIKQLATTSLVYHGAEHTRFGHSLGVMHLASAVLESVTDKNPGLFDTATRDWYRQILRIIGLTHDLGHAPFSHASETLFEGNLEHEDYTRKILLETEVGTCIRKIGAETRQKYGEKFDITPELIWMIYDGTDVLNEQYISPDFQFLKSFMDGELDCDKMDYLLRDSYYCGVQYGHYDLDRLVESFTVYRSDDGSALRLAIERGGVHAVEEFVLARYFMFLQVYFHKTRRLLDKRLTDCLGDILPGGYFPTDVYEYLEWNDAKVMREIDKSRTMRSARAFLERETMSCIYATNVHMNKEGGMVFGIMENSLAARLAESGLSEEDVSLHLVSDRPRKPVHAISEEALDERGIPVVVGHQKEPVSILDESLLLASLKKEIHIQRLYVSNEYKVEAERIVQELLEKSL
ncbi:HD domain-containing protein [Gordonibacter sp. 28C]|uniref:HD domain-containing protein n=1 Tax=Gordonibacter sp. 28C TaxID=2078569 RepID=UPI0018F38A49|nr:HD domain-containing protein [Gordonibacter sp. 28C]